MLVHRITQLGNSRPIIFNIIAAHLKQCSVQRDIQRCPGSGKSKDSKTIRPICPVRAGKKSGGGDSSPLVRAELSGKCRMGFIPEEWFLFFKNKTGVSGPYYLLLGIVNYACSKEIFVMEHEYYSGCSIALIVYLLCTRMGSMIGSALDKEVDAIHAGFQQERIYQQNFHQGVIKDCEMGIKRAEGQKDLMDAKKENIALQLEAAYRERLVTVYDVVKGRIMYQIRSKRAIRRVHQAWMIEWVLKNVHASITPEFQDATLKSAINEITAMASRTK